MYTATTHNIKIAVESVIQKLYVVNSGQDIANSGIAHDFLTYMWEVQRSLVN